MQQSTQAEQHAIDLEMVMELLDTGGAILTNRDKDCAKTRYKDLFL